MRIVRFIYNNRVKYGKIDGDMVRVLHASPFEKPDTGPRFIKADIIPLQEVRLLAPCEPSKIVCLGLNYRSHATEFKQRLPDQPLLFLKPPSALIGPEDSIILPPGSERIDYECELAVVIGRKAKNVPQTYSASYIMGFTCFNDVTDRIAQARDGQ